jgi:mannitol-specific phosphotransferase system IIBC component
MFTICIIVSLFCNVALSFVIANIVGKQQKDKDDIKNLQDKVLVLESKTKNIVAED